MGRRTNVFTKKCTNELNKIGHKPSARRAVDLFASRTNNNSYPIVFQRVDAFVEDSLLNDFYKFDEILRQDRSMCARQMICQIAATPENQLDQVEINLLKLLR